MENILEMYIVVHWNTNNNKFRTFKFQPQNKSMNPKFWNYFRNLPL